MQFGIQSIPAVVVVQNAKPVDGFVGDMTEEQLKASFHHTCQKLNMLAASQRVTYTAEYQ